PSRASVTWSRSARSAWPPSCWSCSWPSSPVPGSRSSRCGCSLTATAPAVFVLAAGNGMFFFLTQFLQQVREYSPLQAGFAFVPLALVILASSGAAARLLPRLGAKTLIAVGAGVISLALLWMTRLTPQADYATALLGPLMIAGLGMGAVMVGATTVLSSGIRAEDAGAAS